MYVWPTPMYGVAIQCGQTHTSFTHFLHSCPLLRARGEREGGLIDWGRYLDHWGRVKPAENQDKKLFYYEIGVSGELSLN